MPSQPILDTGLHWVVEVGKHVGGRRKLVRVTHVMRLGTEAALKAARPRIGFLWTVKHRFYRAGESDRPPWGGSAGTPHLGHGEARPTTLGPSRVVASLLSFRASPCIAPDGARTAPRTRWQTGSATRPPANGSSGSGESQPTVDRTRSALFSFAAGATRHNVSVNEASKRT
jgi:hypothetical protein